MFHPSLKAKMDALETQKATLEVKLAETGNKPPVLLHPGLTDIYRSKVADLTAALNEPSTRTEAGEIIRSLLTSITLTPEGNGLSIELVGELAGLLSLSQTQNAHSVEATGGSVSLVAGGRNQRGRTRLRCFV